MSGDFDSFARAILSAALNKADQAASFVWWAERHDGKPSISLDEICTYFALARFAQPNRSRLERELRGAKFVIRDKSGQYQLTQDGISEGDSLFDEFLPQEKVGDLVSEIIIRQCPYISDSDIVDVRKMADFYTSLYCLENSVRRHIEKILSETLGEEWWDKAASSSMKRKEQERRNNEAQNKWIPSRSNSGPLYSLDWPDLVTLIRKYEGLFKVTIPDINFLHRFSDLGNLRNVVAHNGIIDEPMHFKRVELAFHDWAKQVGG
jgi:hypothetical protein